MLISTFRLADSARLVISMAILFSNPLQFYVAISIIFPSLVAPYVERDKHILAEYGLRYGILLFCCKYQNLSNQFWRKFREINIKTFFCAAIEFTKITCKNLFFDLTKKVSFLLPWHITMWKVANLSPTIFCKNFVKLNFLQKSLRFNQFNGKFLKYGFTAFTVHIAELQKFTLTVGKNFVKAKHLLDKSIKSWFDGKNYGVSVEKCYKTHSVEITEILSHVFLAKISWK